MCDKGNTADTSCFGLGFIGKLWYVPTWQIQSKSGDRQQFSRELKVASFPNVCANVLFLASGQECAGLQNATKQIKNIRILSHEDKSL